MGWIIKIQGFEYFYFQLCLNWHKMKSFEYDTTGAAVIFLQLCILVTCVLCIYSAKRPGITWSNNSNDENVLHFSIDGDDIDYTSNA